VIRLCSNSSAKLSVMRSNYPENGALTRPIRNEGYE
jgi:hypothetical protein